MIFLICWLMNRNQQKNETLIQGICGIIDSKNYREAADLAEVLKPLQRLNRIEWWLKSNISIIKLCYIKNYSLSVSYKLLGLGW